MNLLEVFKDTENLVEFPAGSMILEEGAEGDCMYVVVKGEVRLSLHDKDIATAGPGDMVGEMALINLDVRSATATAKTDCELAQIDEKTFNLMLQHVPEFALHVMNVMADRLEAAYETIGH